jgi:hypothetical protein
MAAEEDIRTPSRAQPEPRSKTVPREAKARDRARIVRWTPKRRRFTSPRPGTSAATRFGATPPRGPLPDFQGPRGRSGHRRNCGALRVPNHISLLEDSMELERSCRKENSSRISRRRLRVLLGCPDELSCEGPNYKRFRCRVPE